MLRIYRHRLVLLFLFAQLLTPLEATASHGIGAPKAKLWEKWTAHDPAATATLDHSTWGEFLKKYVRPHSSGVNRIAYAKVRKSDRRDLNRYIRQLTEVPISRFSRDEQFAYWINLYNSLTMKVILDDYPVESIRDIKSGFFSMGPWKKKLITVEGEDLTLNDIEHRILRPIWKDPRVHYAVNCASIGCPNLQPIPFTGTTNDALLDKAAREFINHPRGARVDRGRLVVASIYVWFHEDFGNSDKGVIEHLRRYAGPQLSAALSGVMRIADDRYDWALNDVGNATVVKRKRHGSDFSR
jgi:hypothetical protein